MKIGKIPNHIGKQSTNRLPQPTFHKDDNPFYCYLPTSLCLYGGNKINKLNGENFDPQKLTATWFQQTDS